MQEVFQSSVQDVVETGELIVRSGTRATDFIVLTEGAPSVRLSVTGLHQ